MLGTDDVAQHADSLDLQFNDVAWLYPAAQFEPAPASDRSTAEHVAGHQPLLLRQMRDDRGETKAHPAKRSLRPQLAIDARSHARSDDVKRVRRDESRTDRGGEILPEPWAQPDLHLPELDVARAPVVEDGVSGDRVGCLLNRNAEGLLPDDRRELQLEVQLIRVARPGNNVLWPEHGVAVSLPVHGDLI